MFLDIKGDPHFNEIYAEPPLESNLALFSSATKFTLKIGDFGESKSNLSYDKSSLSKGNWLFKQPEYKQKDQHKADVWCFGTMVLYLLMPVRLSNDLDGSFYELDDDEIKDFIDKSLD